jgi:hypothetical protein
MSNNCLKRAFRCCSGPVLFLVGVCLLVGSSFIWLDSGAGWIFIVAACSALVAFSLLGSGGCCGAELGSRRNAPRA